jgi:light-independent protochlorophyllide reductase subunit B
MEDHLLELFGGHDTKNSKILTSTIDITSKHKTIIWTSQAEEELKKIPGFVRGKIRRNTEKFAHSKNVTEITIELMYEAKEAIIPF